MLGPTRREHGHSSSHVEMTDPTLTVGQLAALPDQQTLNISFLDRLNNTQSHTEHGPLLWTVLSLGAGGVEVDKLLDDQYQGPNPYITLYVMVIATNGYQTLVSESEIDPEYGNTPVLVSLVEDGVPMTQAPYANTNKAPAQLVVPSDQRGGRYANRICRIVVMNGAVGPDGPELRKLSPGAKWRPRGRAAAWSQVGSWSEGA